MSDRNGKARISAKDWESLYRTYFPKLRDYLTYRGLTPSEAADLAQGVFEKIGKTKVPGDPNTYIYAVARNILSQYRRRQRTERAALEKYARLVGTENEHGSPETSDIGPLREDAAAETERILKTVAARLPARYAELMTLRFIEGLSVKQIAQRLNCSQDAVHKRIQRLRAILRRFDLE